MKRSLSIIVVCLMIVSVPLFAGGAKEEPAAPSMPKAESAAEPATARYDGVTLRIALVSGFNYLRAVLGCLEEAAGELGAKVEASWYSFDEQTDKLLIDYTGGSGAWDFVFWQSSARGGWAETGLILPLGRWIDENPRLVDQSLLAMDDYYPISIEENTYKGEWLGPSLMVTGLALFYRTDLFADPTEQRNFRGKYGYELEVPKTYKEFRDVAEFFTRKKGQMLAGKTLEADFYGTAHSNKPVGFLWYDFVNYLVAFGADDIYDSETMKPTFNSPEAIAAGEYYVSIAPYQPPGHMSMASGQSTAMFAEGHVAMIIEFFTRGMEMALSPAQSKVADRVEFTSLPVVTGVSGRDGASVHIGNGISVYSLSKNKEAAYKVLELAFSPRIMKKVFIEKGVDVGWIPPRPSTLKAPEVQQAAPIMKEVAEKLMEDKSIYYFYSPTLPEYVNAMDICATAVAKTLAGQDTVTAAFNDAQDQLVELFKKAGLIK
jgi:multiple sugar transport system substrate-binding protein